MLVSRECCRRSGVRGCFALLEVHAFNETVRDGINVPNLAVRKDIAIKAFHELMNFDVGNAALLVDYLKWFHVRIKLLPLTGPVGPDLFFADDTTAFRCPGPANVITHERQGAVDIPMVESRVGLSYQCLCVRHESLRSRYVYFTRRCKKCSGGSLRRRLHYFVHRCLVQPDTPFLAFFTRIGAFSLKY